jgi:hypothetical protein
MLIFRLNATGIFIQKKRDRECKYQLISLIGLSYKLQKYQKFELTVLSWGLTLCRISQHQKIWRNFWRSRPFE